MKSIILLLTLLFLSSCNIASYFVVKESDEDKVNEQDLIKSRYEEDGMLYIPGGWFIMGSNKRKNEQPLIRKSQIRFPKSKKLLFQYLLHNKPFFT